MIDPTVYARTRNMPSPTASSSSSTAAAPAPATPEWPVESLPAPAAKQGGRLGGVVRVDVEMARASGPALLDAYRDRFLTKWLASPVPRPKPAPTRKGSLYLDERAGTLSPAESRGLSPAEQQIAQCLGRDITGPRSRKVLF